MQGFYDLVESERGAWSIGVLTLSLALVAVGKLTAQEWLDFVRFLSTALIASKTVTTAMERRAQIPKAEVVTEGT